MATGTIHGERSWRGIGTATGNTGVTIPSDVVEITADVQYGSANLYFPFHLIRNELAPSSKVFTIGYYINASSSGFCQISVSSSSINVNSLYISGTDYTASARMRVFGK